MAIAKPLHELSIAEAGRLLRDGEITSTKLTEHALVRIAAIDPQIHAFITITAERALADAAAADDFFCDAVDLGPMQGIPYALKDIYDTQDIRTTCHSKLRLDHVPATDSVAARLRAQGGVLLGKLATHEFALGGPSFDLPFPPARNPGMSIISPAVRRRVRALRSRQVSCAWRWGRIPAARSAALRLSVAPSASNRPTGSCRGAASSRSRPRSIIADRWPGRSKTRQSRSMRSPASIPGSGERRCREADCRSRLDRGVDGLVIGMPRHFFVGVPGASQETVQAIENAAQVLAGLGAKIEEITLPDYELFSACGRVIMFCEAFAIHEQDFRSRPLDFGQLTYQRMALGAFVTAADLTQAMRLRRELALAVNRQLQRCDALLTASALAPAPRFDAATPHKPSESPIQSMPSNVTGNPAISVPTGLSATGLPLSMQIVGRPFDEATLFQIAAAYERETRHFIRRPALATLTE